MLKRVPPGSLGGTRLTMFIGVLTRFQAAFVSWIAGRVFVLARAILGVFLRVVGRGLSWWLS